MGRSVTTRTAEYPRPDHFLLHISDTHLLAGGGLLYDRVSSEQHLRSLFDEFEASGARPEAIVFTGDLADRGEPDAYDRIRRIVDPVAERLDTQVIWVMGNHDDRAAFRTFLLNLGRQVAAAAKEATVFGFGGTSVMAKEQAALEEISTALSGEPAPPASGL